MVLGPTGTGKTELAVRVAERIGGEIVGCDALQVYRDVTVGTAKPPEELRRRVAHHLVDVVDPKTSFTLGDYVTRAEAAVAAIASRGRVPVVVGGTGMYLRGLLRGIVAAPASDPLLRERLRRMAVRFGSPRLHRWLKSRRVSARIGSAAKPTTAPARLLPISPPRLPAGRTWARRWLKRAFRFRRHSRCRPGAFRLARPTPMRPFRCACCSP